MKKTYWYPAKLIEDPLTGNVYVLMYGGSGRVRYVRASDIQDSIWNEPKFSERKKEKENNKNQ